MLSHSGYRETTPFPDTYFPVIMRTQSATLRYDLGQSSAIKLQLDRFKDRSPTPFAGSAHVISVGFDTVF